MEQPKYLIDTNVVIDYLGEKIPQSGMLFMNNVVDEIPIISVITKIEVLGFNAPQEHYQLLTDFMNDATILELSSKVVNKCIEIRKKHSIKLPDAVIASTAIVYDLIIISRNVKDFQNIEELKVINPYKI